MAVKFSIQDLFKKIGVRFKKTSENQDAEKDVLQQPEEAETDVIAENKNIETETSKDKPEETESASDNLNSQGLESESDEKAGSKKNSFNILKSDKIKKILKSRVFKNIFIMIIMLLALSALAGSVYISYEKAKAKHARPLIKKSPEYELSQKPVEVIDRSHYKVIQLNDFGTANPFNPNQTIEVPKTGLSRDKNLLPLPPAGDIHESDAAMIMGTTISGILYDEINSSAIINIEGTEYFVKPNDVVNKYKILAISPDQVRVKYGNNIYEAGVGQLLTKVESNSNIVNLNRKFGGNFQDNSTAIKVRKNK